MINVKILSPEYGDKQLQLTTQEFQELYKNKFDRKGWSIFSQDTAEPIETQASQHGHINPTDVKDGQSYVLVPNLMGG